MSLLDSFTSKLSKDITKTTLPEECRLYFHYAEYYLEGFSFKNDILNTAIRLLKEEYNYYQNNKNTEDYKTAYKKCDDNTFFRDFMDNRDDYYCAEAFAFLLMFRIVYYYRYQSHGYAFDVFKKNLIQVIKSLDKKKIPESFFCHFGADEYLQEEQKKQEDITQKYLDLYDEYTKVCLKLSKYEDNE